MIWLFINAERREAAIIGRTDTLLAYIARRRRDELITHLLGSLPVADFE